MMNDWHQRMTNALQLNGKGERTQEAYTRAVRMLAQFYDKTPDLVTEQELQEYFLQRKNVNQWSPKTKESDGVSSLGERLVEDEDAGLHPGVGIEAARRKGDDGDEGVFDEHPPQLFVGGLALEDDALGHDDASAASGREVLGHVVHEEDFAALGLNGEALVGHHRQQKQSDEGARFLLPSACDC